MSKPHSHRPPSGRTNLASCIVATIFLIFVIIVILIVLFTVFKPRDPKISVNAVQLPSFSIANNTVNFTFSQYVSVKNPNRAAFSHYDSSLQLLYSGSQVGFMFIPAGKIDSGRTQYMAATFAVQSFPLSSSPDAVVNVPPTFSAAEAAGAGAGLGGGFDNGAGGLGGFGGVGTAAGGGGGGGGGGNGFRVGPTMEIESRIRMGGRVRVLHFFTHHVEAKSSCRVAIAVSDGSVLGFHC